MPAPYSGIYAIVSRQRWLLAHWRGLPRCDLESMSARRYAGRGGGAAKGMPRPNGERFRNYVEQMLAPTLSRGDVVMLDNLSSHNAAGIETVIQARGAKTCLPAALQPRSQPDQAALRQATLPAPSARQWPPVDITLLPDSAPAAYTTAARSLVAAVTASPPTGAPGPV